MDTQKTGRLIAAARREQGLTQRELAERLHVSDRAVSKWERGLNLPEAALFEPLCQALGFTVTELLRGEREAPSVPALEQAVDTAVALAGEETRRKKSYRRAALVLTALLLLAAAVLGRSWWQGYQRKLWIEQDSHYPSVFLSYSNGLEKHTTLSPLPCGMYGPFVSDGSLFTAPAAATVPWGEIPYLQNIELEWNQRTVKFQLSGEKSRMEVKILRWPKEKVGVSLGLEDGEEVPFEMSGQSPPLLENWEGPVGVIQNVVPDHLYSIVIAWGEGYYVEYPFLVT